MIAQDPWDMEHMEPAEQMIGAAALPARDSTGKH